MSKLAIIAEHYPRLSETFIQRQVRALAAPLYSHTLDRAALSDQDGNIPALADLSEHLHPLRRWLNWQIKVIRWKLSRYPSYHWHPSSLKVLKAALEREVPSVVLAQFGTTGINVMEVCHALGIPLVVHFHGKDATQLIRNKVYLQELKQLFRRATALVVVNAYMRKVFVGLGCAAEKIHLIPYGVPVPNEYPVRKSSPHTPFHFLAVGRMVEKKAPLTTIKAFEHALTLNPDLHLTMIGGGELFEEVQAYVAQRGLEEKMDLTGPLPFSEVEVYFKLCDAFVQHSVTAPDGDGEGWPLAIGEAAAAGLPVIATRHMGIPTQVVDGKTGFLVDEGDSQAMGEKMAEMAQFDRVKYRTFSKDAYNHIRINGNFSKQVGKLHAFLNNLAWKHEKTRRSHS